MDDAATDALLEKACSTPEGSLKASFLLADLEKVAPAYAHPGTRADAEALLKAWSESDDPLRKGMALAWLARARGALAEFSAGAARGAERAASAQNAAGKLYARAEGKAGDLGAAAGEKLARSKFNAKRMGAAREAGGIEAKARMSERLQPNTPQRPGFVEGSTAPRRPQFAEGSKPAPGGRMQVEGGHHPPLGATPSGRGGMFIDENKPRNFGQEQARRAGNSSSIQNPADRTAAVHADALASAFRAGADHAANAHAGAAARHGRVAARHAFKAGMQLTALAGGAAAAGTIARATGTPGSLSEAQHEERVNAGKASHHRQAAPQQQPALGKSFGTTVGAFARKAIDSGLAAARAPGAGKAAGIYAAKKLGGAVVGLGATAALKAGISAVSSPAPAPHVQKLKALVTPKPAPGTGE